jgi:nucleoside-diphosphate-sugar epimerase
MIAVAATATNPARYDCPYPDLPPGDRRLRPVEDIFMRVLLTGAAGRIGAAFYQETAERYWFRLADRDPAGLVPRDGHEVVAFDIADLDACRVACAGIDAVIHLAADPSPSADFAGSLLANNITGTYNVFRAAKDAGVRRVIFASSIHAVAGYSEETPIPIDVSVRPLNMYGVSKCFGEAVAAYFASEGLSTIAVRIGAYDAPWIRENPTPRALSAYVSPRDLNQLFVRALEATPAVTHAVVAGQSNNRRQRLDLTETRRVLGYDPQDDGFALFGVEP